MLRVDQVHVIRHKVLIEGQSVRRVALEMGIGRNTVRKFLEGAEPGRVEKDPRSRPVFEAVRRRMEELWVAWGARMSGKQRLTTRRLHQQLREEGYRVGITLVGDWVREERRRKAEVYIPLEHRAGDSAQVDFFEVHVELEGALQKVWKFLMRLMYSGHDFAWLYERCDQLALLDGHVRAFEYFGAVPRRCVYDNLSAAVRKVCGSERRVTERFAALSRHYLFEACFARVGEGHDKGGVESRGKAVRLRHLVPVPRGNSLGELSSSLLGALGREAGEKRDANGRSVLERFEQEKGQMLPLPAASFEARRLVALSVSSKALVSVEGASYSVPSHWARLDAIASVGVVDIKLECRGETLLCPKQQAGRRLVKYKHYLPELSRKPQAVRQVSESLLAELGEPYMQLWRLLVSSHGEREAARVLSRVLGALVDHGEAAVVKALQEALAAGRPNLLALAPLLDQRSGLQKVAVPASLAEYEVEAASIELYDALLGGARS